MFSFTTTFSHIVSFEFQPWALLSLFAACVNAGVALFIWKKSSRDVASKIYILCLILVSVWGVTEVMQRSSAFLEGAVFWGEVGVVAPVFLGVLFFTFTLIFIERGMLFENILALLILYGPGIGLLYFLWNTELIVAKNYEKVFWGWFPHVGPFYLVFFLWAVGFFIISFFLLARFYLETQEVRKRRQIGLILFGISIPLVGGAVTDGLFPFLGINLPGLATVFTTIFGAIITYAILKYKLFVVSPAGAFSTVIDSMSESLIVLNRSYQIELVNKPVLALLRYEERELFGEGLERVIAPEAWEDCKKHCLRAFARERGVIHHESQLRTKDGDKIPVRFSVSALKGPAGELVGIVMLAFDITQEKKLIHDLESTTRELQLARYNLEKQLSRAEKKG